MKKIVFWDLDGTLIDTLDDLGAAVNHALALRGLPQLGPDDFRKMVGHGVRNLVAQAVEKAAEDAVEKAAGDAVAKAAEDAVADGSRPALEDVRADAYIDSALADFKEYYCANIDVFTRPYPGMPELLSELSKAGMKMAVVSNKFQEGTERLVKEFFPDVDFVAILGNRPGWPLKPSPEIVEDVLRRVAGGGGESGISRADGGGEPGISRADAILVGDSPTDMRTAANGCIDAIAVTWGYSSQIELAEFLASDPAFASTPGGPVSRPRFARSVEELRRMLAEG